MADRRAWYGAALVAAVLCWQGQALGSAATEACCTCNCSGTITQCVTTFDCATTCLNMDCAVNTSQVCAVGVFGGCDGSCGAICQTATATASHTPTATATATVTGTPVPNGGACTDTAQCAPGLSCINSVCSPIGAPAISSQGLGLGAGLLALIAALSLRRRRA